MQRNGLHNHFYFMVSIRASAYHIQPQIDLGIGLPDDLFHACSSFCIVYTRMYLIIYKDGGFVNMPGVSLLSLSVYKKSPEQNFIPRLKLSPSYLNYRFISRTDTSFTFVPVEPVIISPFTASSA